MATTTYLFEKERKYVALRKADGMAKQSDNRPDPSTPDGAVRLARYVADTLPHDPFDAVTYVHANFAEIRGHGEGRAKGAGDFHNAYLSFYALWKELMLLYGHNMTDVVFSTDKAENIARIAAAIENSSQDILPRLVARSFDTISSEFKEKIGGKFYYQLSDEELSTIQSLLNELREHIAKSGVLDARHRRRLLKRVEDLQRELHKEVSDFDHVWGLLVESAAYLGDAGEKAKPITDRLRDLKEIFWNNIKQRENLPPKRGFPELKNQRKEEGS
jgi:hypothetical protein